MTAEITRTKNVDSNGNVSYRVTRDGVHLGDVLKLASGKYRPELVSGDHGPDGTLKDGVAWVTTYAKPTPDAIRAVIELLTWHLDVKIPAEIHDARYVNRHARRLASLRKQRDEAKQTLSRLTAELATAVQESLR